MPATRPPRSCRRAANASRCRQDVSTVEGCKALAAPDRQARERQAGHPGQQRRRRLGRADFDEFPESGWDKVVNLNLKSPFFLTQALHRSLCKAPPAIDHVRPRSSTSARSTAITLNPHETYSYHASKSGLIYLTRRMAAAAGAGPHRRHRHRPGRLRLGDEPGGPRPGRRSRQAHPAAPHRPRRGHGGRRHLSCASRAGDYVVGDTIAVDGGRRWPAREAF